jgi:carboxypeptidase A1
MKLVLLLLAAVVYGRISHKGEYIVRCRYKEGSSIHALETSQVDVQGVLADNFVDVRIQRPEDQDLVDKYLTNCEVVVEDLEKLTQEVERQNQEARLRDDPVWFSAYHTYDELRTWYQNQSTRFPNLVKFIPNIHPNNTNTPGGRQIWAISIFNYTAGTPRYRAWHTAGIHAREWVAPSTANYIADQIISRFNARDDEFVVNWVNQVETWIVGSLNPDGYNFSWTTNRQWRKNRKPAPSGSTCIGVDCNRNFPDHWGQGGSSTNPCDDTYMGVSASSEVEVTAVVAKFRELAASARIIMAIDWHSYSQLFLRPYGWTNNLSPDETRFVSLGNAYVAEIRAASGLTYTSQRSIQLYVTTGSAGDWYYGASNSGTSNRTAAWTVELRPTGSNPGFVLPPDQITPTGNENWRALRQLMNNIRLNPLP